MTKRLLESKLKRAFVTNLGQMVARLSPLGGRDCLPLIGRYPFRRDPRGSALGPEEVSSPEPAEPMLGEEES